MSDKFYVKNGKHIKLPLYSVWVGMRNRCRNPHPKYKYWHGKGVRVCSEWSDYDAFADWSLSNGYVPGLSIDRIDGDGNYHPDNCRWITVQENGGNKVIDPVGCNNGRSVLTEHDVRAIRASDKTCTALHKVYGVSIAHISRIRLGQAWKCLDD